MIRHLTTSTPEAEHAPPVSVVRVAGGAERARRSRGGAERPLPKPQCRRHQTPKKGKKGKKPDKRKKTWSKGITAPERKDLKRADGFATVIRRPLNTTLDFHPCHLTGYPTGSLDQFFAELRMRISTWLRRKGIGTYWVWTRENYEGERREHLHMVLYLPPRLRTELEAHIRSLPGYQGNEDLVRVGKRTTKFNPVTNRWEDGLQYRMKQLRGDAVGAPSSPHRLNRETKSRHDGARVAPVFGQRCGVSETLTEKAEQAWRAWRQEQFVSPPANDHVAVPIKGMSSKMHHQPQPLADQDDEGLGKFA
jgi:hypothetical protein